MEPAAELVKCGEKRALRRRNGDPYSATLGRVWRIDLNGKTIGFVRYDMVTHETRSAGRRYVNNRWESPGWTYSDDGQYPWLHSHAKSEAIDQLVRRATRADSPGP